MSKDNKKNNVSIRLRYMRKENLGMSIDKVSTLAETSSRSWIYYENGSRMPPIEIFISLENKEILIDLNYLVYGRVSPNYLSENELLLISKVRAEKIECSKLIDHIDKVISNDNKDS